MDLKCVHSSTHANFKKHYGKEPDLNVDYSREQSMGSSVLNELLYVEDYIFTMTTNIKDLHYKEMMLLIESSEFGRVIYSKKLVMYIM